MLFNRSPLLEQRSTSLFGSSVAEPEGANTLTGPRQPALPVALDRPTPDQPGCLMQPLHRTLIKRPGAYMCIGPRQLSAEARRHLDRRWKSQTIGVGRRADGRQMSGGGGGNPLQVDPREWGPASVRPFRHRPSWRLRCRQWRTSPILWIWLAKPPDSSS